MKDGYKKLCNISDLKEKQGKRFIVDEMEIATFKIDNEIFAINNICPHQHTAILYDGFIENKCIVCPAHGWIFDLKTGKLLNGGRGIDSYPVIVENDEVFALINPKELKW
jgi:nitrite reductase/ring-hydroxylating ferredoxin subunit